MQNKKTLWMIIGLFALIIACLLVVLVVFMYTSSQGEPDTASSTRTAISLTSTALVVVPSQTPVNAVPTPSVEKTPGTAPTSEGSVQETIPPGSTVPVISASANTNCRLGPSQVYEIVGYLLPGQQANVLGSDDTQTWWYIENPSRAGGFCWVWSGSTSVEGDVSVLPVITPPPPPVRPEVAYTAAFSRVNICDGASTAMFQVTNLGIQSLESASLTIQNLGTNVVSSGVLGPNSPFTALGSDCPPGLDSLLAGESGHVGAVFAGLTPVKNEYKATIRLCTQDNLGGTCEIQTVNFVHP